MKNILILGGGFGGVYTAHYLLKKLKVDEAKITLLSNNNYFLFVPLIHEVATGNIKIHNVVEPIREILKGKNFEFHKATVENIDLKSKKVKTNVGNFEYDYVVVGLGSTTNFYDIPGKEHCLTLKSLHDAYNIRNTVIEKLERASQKHDKKCLKFVIIGAGPTGVELAGEMSDWVYKSFRKSYPDVNWEDAEISLICPSDKVLKGVNEHLRDMTMKILKKKGINIITNAMAKKVGPDFVEIEINKKLEKLDARTIIWTAGVKPVDIKVKGIEKIRGTLPVNTKLQIQNYKNSFALGDIAGFVNKDGSRPPPTAQLAHRQSKFVANNIVSLLRNKELKDFNYKTSGFLASLGKGHAIAHIHGLKFHGFFAWWLWRTIYLSKIIGFENKLRVVIDWTFDLFFPRDTSQV